MFAQLAARLPDAPRYTVYETELLVFARGQTR
jgi:hypothetical protein